MSLPPFQAHSPTSLSAAKEILPHLGRLEQIVYSAFKGVGEAGLTDEELIAETRLSPSTARPRRIDLVGKKLVKDSGRVRKTRSKRNAVVWQAVPASERLDQNQGSYLP